MTAAGGQPSSALHGLSVMILKLLREEPSGVVTGDRDLFQVVGDGVDALFVGALRAA